MDAAELAFLLSAAGQRLLAAGMAAYDDEEPLRLARRLRSLGDGYPAEQVAAALTQVRLRRAATGKFGEPAARMYFTPAGLEQATHPAVAAHRAERASALVESGGTCLDLGCGIGSDLVALARAGFDVTGADLDGGTAAVAAANLAALGLPGLVRTGRAETVERASFDLVFADPARRRGTTRVFDPQAFSPPWDFVLELLEPAEPRGGREPQVVVKLAPGLDHALVPDHAEAEWVSLGRELKEVALWSPAAGATRRRATVLSEDGTSTSTSDEAAPAEPPGVRDVGAYLYEPDPAVVRAHLVSVVVAAVDGWLLDAHIAYVSSDRLEPTGLARAFRVVEVLPFKEKPLRAALRNRNIGTLTIKKRGVGVTPEDLRRRLALRGDEAATLILTRTPRSARALLVEPLD